jgi:hypothetical protein
VLYRPLKFLRVEGGALYNYVGFGVRGGVTVLPHYWIAPSLTLEAGHYFEADASSKISRFVTIPDDLKPFLQRIGYTFASAQIGLEVGHPDWFVFFVRAGLSRVWLNVRNAQQGLSSATGAGEARVTSIADPGVRLGVPSAKVGFMVFFY